MQEQAQQPPRWETPTGRIIELPLSVFPTAKLMVECECNGRNFIEVRSLLRKQANNSVGEAIENFRCDKCGQPATTACLLSQIIVR